MNPVRHTIIMLMISLFLHSGLLWAQGDQPKVEKPGEGAVESATTADTAPAVMTEATSVVTDGEVENSSENVSTEVGTGQVMPPEKNNPTDKKSENTENPAGSPQAEKTATKTNPPTNNPGNSGGWDFLKKPMENAREARCKTAICFGDSGNKYAIEPLIDIPVGLTFALGKESDSSHWNAGPLAAYINNHEFSVQFVAGLRFWFVYDLFSLSVYFSKPILNEDETIHVQGSNFKHSASKVRRPYPGLAIGLFADVLWIGFDLNELRNGDQSSTMDPNFKPNQVLSRVWSVTLCIAPANTLRSGIGAAMSKKDDGQN